MYLYCLRSLTFVIVPDSSIKLRLHLSTILYICMFLKALLIHVTKSIILLEKDKKALCNQSGTDFNSRSKSSTDLCNWL